MGGKPGASSDWLPPSSEVEEAEQLAEALRRSLRLSDEQPSGTPSPAAAGPGPEGQPAAEPPTAAERQPSRGTARPAALDLRAYAVWRVPGRPDAVGVWFGPHPECWAAIEAACPNGRYQGGVRLRRFNTLPEARAGYLREAARHQAPVPPVEHLL